jgi:hypothetical protein
VNVANIMAGFSKIVPQHANHFAEKDTPPPRGDLSVGNDRESRECLRFLVNKLVEGENKDPFCGSSSISYTFRARCPLSRCGLAAIFEVADVNENSLALCLRLSPQSNICEAWLMTLRKYCYQCQRDSGDKVSKNLQIPALA